jgi:hypothetical protein
MSRNSSANSKKKSGANFEVINLNKSAKMNFNSGLLKTGLGYPSHASNYSKLFNKKERDNSKGTRVSPRKTSTNLSPKSISAKPPPGKDKLSRLLQTTSHQHESTKPEHLRSSGYLSQNGKRKNSSSSSINQKKIMEPRSSVAGKSASKLTHVAAGMSYLSAKSTNELKKEILANKAHQMNLKKNNKKEEGKLVAKGTPNLLSSLITQVKQNTKKEESVPKEKPATSKSSKGVKKKKRDGSPKALTGKITLKNHCRFYMQKLELAFKDCTEDEESILFRQHFKQTIQTLSLLQNVGKTVVPYEDSVKIHMPPLSDPSIKYVQRSYEDLDLRLG